MPHGLPLISSLQQFSVATQFFYVSSSFYALFFICIFALLLHALARSCAEIHDPEYSEGKITNSVANAVEGAESSNQDSDEEDETEENRGKQRKFIKFERRVLAGLTFLVVAIVSINNLTAYLMQAICIAASVMLYVLFNLTWAPSRWAKLLFTVPLLLSYVACFIFTPLFSQSP